jgi:hypothetical protein
MKISRFLILPLLSIVLGQFFDSSHALNPKKELREKEPPEQAIQKIFIPQKDIDDLYDIVEGTDKILRKNRIPYSLEGGGAIGLLRNGGPLPWDDDIDLTIPEEYEEVLLGAKQDFDDAGLKFSLNVCEGGRFDGLSLYKVKKLEGSLSFVDIFIYAKDPERGVYDFKVLANRRSFPKTYFGTDGYDNLRDVPFGDLPAISVRPEKDLRAYLSRAYPTWEKEVVLYNHSRGGAGRFPLHSDPRFSQYAKRSPKSKDNPSTDDSKS